VEIVDLTGDSDGEMQESVGDSDIEMQEPVNEGDGFIHIDDLEAQAPPTKKVRLRYLSSSSSDEKVDNEAPIFNDEVRIASGDDEADMEKDEGNEEVIESPVRLRRSGRERKATRKSLNYHAEMRKGR
jgi:hypothetical protein